MRIARPVLVLYLFFLLSTAAGTAQSPPPIDPALLVGNLHWRSIGPANTGGSIDDFAAARVPDQPDAIYVATAGGGGCKNTNQGTSRAPIVDRRDAITLLLVALVAP